MLIMENCSNGDLRGFIKETKGDPRHFKAYWKYFRDIISGLAEIHGRRQVHRDLKPENVFLAILLPFEGVAKLGDFGLLRDEAYSMTKGAGTKFYQSPEQQNEQEYGAPSDIWAAGVILFELFTGELPFKSVADIVLKPPKSLPSHVPKEVAELLSNLLDKDHKKRMTSEEVLTWLNKQSSDAKSPQAGKL
jgi:serine/threonine protein kinase